MQRDLTFFTLLLALFLSTPAISLADVEITLDSGNTLHADCIQWGTDSTLILETQGQPLRSLSLNQIQSLKIENSEYDRQTIRLAADQYQQSQSVQFASHTHKRFTPMPVPVYQSPLHAPFEPRETCSAPCDTRCSRGIILGVHEDPLNAYQPLLKQYYPNGVPTLERGYALGLMRATVAQQALGYGPVPGLIPPVPAPEPLLGKLTQIRVQATPINTQGKADWNALSIRLQGFDQLGNPAALTGNVKIQLFGQRQMLLPVWDQRFAAVPQNTITLGQWTRNCATTPLTSAPRAGNQFGTGQASDQTWIVKLFPQIPEHNLNIYALGEVQVSLLSPGKGTFAASTPAVPLKHVSLNRDASLATTGTRFFPGETTSAGISRTSRLNHNGPSRPDSRPFTVQP
ncbi:hypothetical protein [Gimesia maris]|uniref:hypothetical protein n=1 Tax=Gimesia maris TaxID=122 RepID=UPI00241E666A|nr:hypothetical protein [Gimesia maris]|tara:strand:+ start:150657 stop:151859 length:1203 start_codon:yes stop_codon:yes gene_type:complete